MKQQLKGLFISFVVILLTVLPTGCSQQSTPKILKIGVTAGPHAEIMDAVKKTAEKEGLKIEIVEFNDYIQPNVALSQGDIDVNSFQHMPYLDNIIKDRHYDIVSVANSVIFPMGIYSAKAKSIDELPVGAIVAIPNDPTNESRALLLLEKSGVLQLKPGAGIKAAITDIVANPKKIMIKELDAAQIPRSLADMDAAAINTNYALTAGLSPAGDTIAMEDINSPYANIIAVRCKDKESPAIQQFIKAYHSDEVKAFIAEHFKGTVIPAW